MDEQVELPTIGERMERFAAYLSEEFAYQQRTLRANLHAEHVGMLFGRRDEIDDVIQAFEHIFGVDIGHDDVAVVTEPEEGM